MIYTVTYLIQIEEDTPEAAAAEAVGWVRGQGAAVRVEAETGEGCLVSVEPSGKAYVISA